MDTPQHSFALSLAARKNGPHTSIGFEGIRNNFRWARQLLALAILAAILGLPIVRPNDIPAYIAALFNTLTSATCTLFILKRNKFAALPPALFISYTVVFVSLSTIIICLIRPELTVFIGRGLRYRLLENNLELQAAACLSTVCFTAVLLPILPKLRPAAESYWRADIDTYAWPAFVLFATISFCYFLTVLLGYGKLTGIGYLTHGFHRYGLGLCLLAGAGFRKFTRRQKAAALLVLCANATIFSITNTRTYAVMPTMFFFVGILALGNYSTAWKLQVFSAMLASILLLLVLGNVGRLAGARVWTGGTDKLQQRVSLVRDNSDLALSRSSLDSLLSRIFFTGGHQILQEIPGRVPYKAFTPTYYISEVFSQMLLPRGLASRLVPPMYEEKSKLIEIGHIFTASHSVERSFLGSCWELGGWPMVTILSLLAGGIFGIFINIYLSLRTFTRSGFSLFFAVLCDRSVVVVNEGIPSMAHEFFYGIAVGSAFLVCARVINKITPPRSQNIS